MKVWWCGRILVEGGVQCVVCVMRWCGGGVLVCGGVVVWWSGVLVLWSGVWCEVRGVLARIGGFVDVSWCEMCAM